MFNRSHPITRIKSEWTKRLSAHDLLNRDSYHGHFLDSRFSEMVFHASWDNVLRDFHLAPSHPDDSAMRMSLMKFVAVILLFGLAALRASPEEQQRETATAKGQIDWAAHNVTVLFFILHDCPICNRYVPEMNRIIQDYRNHDFGFIAVYPEADFTQKDAQRHAREYQFDFPFVIDPNLRLAAEIGVKAVPEVAVLNSQRELIYRGRIDDLYADVNKQRATTVHHDLRQVLDKIVAGIKPQQIWFPAVGCPINYGQPGS
jgi:peroxiredoxin